MNTFIATFLVMVSLVGLMAIGYIVKRKTISGSCGGLGAVGVDKACDCPEPCDRRKKRMADEARRQKLMEQQRIL
ncbi:(Na+)-NQR maturation NqrM [Ferrimonas sediminicola]|uniref:(Na+)-NQR maturation NqrM n=1 Tax=Ferrimonas sediminicola TaxID=2569538 RepID=A0A4V5NVA4_9GAMM|nr:(Na+)-NQR maturation NqrM [Ferrimonas sediminicola]TKB49709.1 (Na+)-NQR maturation NqrM [Ferrimonas sediminicola]